MFTSVGSKKGQAGSVFFSFQPREQIEKNAQNFRNTNQGLSGIRSAENSWGQFSTEEKWRENRKEQGFVQGTLMYVMSEQHLSSCQFPWSSFGGSQILRHRRIIWRNCLNTCSWPPSQEDLEKALKICFLKKPSA